MALITSSWDLNQNTEVVFDTTNKTIELLVAGNLSTDGVTLKALYSFTKEEWKDDSALVKFDFPFTPITDESFELKDGWNFKDASTKYLIRTGGWSVVDEATWNNTEIWAGVVGLGSIESDDQLYFDQWNGAINIQLTGQVNQAVQIYSDTNADGTADYDYRGTFQLYVREQGQIFAQASLTDIGVSTMSNIVYRFPISTGADLKITESDANIASNSPYTGMSITYHQTAQTRDIWGVNYDFGIVIDWNNGSAEEIYEYVQYQLRQTSDIDSETDAPTQTGQLQDALLRFVGDNLETLSATNTDGGGTGVYIDNFNSVDTNRITFVDNTDTNRTFPFVAGLTINFNSNLQASTDAVYRVFFTDANGNDFDDSDALIVNDEAGNPISWLIASNASLSFTFDYDGNIQGWRTAWTDADITVVAIGTDSAQHVIATGTIERSNANSVSLVSPLERSYSN